QKELRIREIEAKSIEPDFWKDSQHAANLMREMTTLQKEIDDAKILQELIASNDTYGLETLLKELEVYLYLSGPHDTHNAIFSIHAGQGGADAMDWASILYRMYTRYFEKKGWQFETLEYTPGDEAGIKSATLVVEGNFAYGYLKNEQGVHRLVRLSPFNADQLRHTSFALVEVLPQIEDDTDLDIKDDDLDWDFYRASSKGGQNVQKVSTAVRVKHIPSGIVVTSQSERYQAQNREYALKILKAKLWARHQEELQKTKQDLKGSYSPPSWGNQIRSYVLHPYQMVKDLRTKEETGNVESVLDGNIDIFVEAQMKEDA
ncbi:MAG TPA: peptide chain release factor 2, partial [Candidatus Levybacteria bacterium]|nr:peptide chain release factor 2 [Candidatus Levybacteria bacterium]